MQDKDFDKFINDALEDYTPEDFNPADWDKMEDRLVNMPKAAPAKGFKFSAGKAGFAASMVLLTAVNIYLYTNQPDDEKAQPVQPKQELVELKPAYTATANTGEETVEVQAEATVTKALTEKPAEMAMQQASSSGLKVTPVQENQTKAVAVKNPVKAKNTDPVKKATTANLANVPATTTLTRRPVLPAAQRLSGTAATNSGTVLYAGKGNSGAPVADCAGSSNPVIPFILVGEDTVHNLSIVTKACEPVSIRVLSAEKNEATQLHLSSNATAILSGSDFTVADANQPHAYLNWTPGSEQIRQKPYLVNFKVEDKACPASARTYQLAVQVVAPVQIQVSGDTVVKEGEVSNLVVTGAGNTATFNWSSKDGLLADANAATTSIRPVKSTTYYVKVTAENGCQLSDSIHVRVEPLNVVLTKSDIPNTFTPNGDRKNDFFEIRNLKPGRYKLEVYDRQGKPVYRNESYDNKWDAAGLPEDTYYYVLTDKEDVKRYNGWVEVFR